MFVRDVQGRGWGLFFVMAAAIPWLASCGQDDSCGDGVCDASESAASCPVDCDAVCGDSACTHSEAAGTCPEDCAAVCDDGFCTHDETAATCPTDCPAACGDGYCTHLEDASSCPADCPAECGDGYCTHDETQGECAADCSFGCGDGTCSAIEDAASCPTDCPAVCGDGKVTHDEECDGSGSQACTSTCGSTGTQWCSSCSWGACTPPTEICNGMDDDCDSASDEGFACVLGAVEACDYGGGQPGHRVCEAGCAWGGCICDPDCTGAVCGDDGCGGSCGTCDGDEVCTAARLCGVGSYMFVSSVATTGTLGGLSGADAFCDGLANAAGLAGTYQAFLSDSSSAVLDRLTIGYPVYGMDGALLATDEADLLDGWLSAPIHLDETGNECPRVHAWTGSLDDASSSSWTCDDWTSNLDVDWGSMGAINVTDPSWLYQWIYDGEKTCDQPLPLFCVRTQ